ncbi:MAG TPA: hypothetical protein VIY47_08635 [Ignavibacteriaceae bacterium]
MAEKKSFVNYVAETKTEYKYVLKFAVNEMTDEMIDSLESSLTKYELKSASSFRKTPIQESPLDFPNVKNTSVYICDIVMEYPASLDFLRIYICNSLGISPALLAVYSNNDPRQIETDLYIDRNSPEYKKKYKTRLGSDYEEVPGAAEETYGEKYNTSFLKELEKVRKDREKVTVENPLSPAETIDHSTLPKDYDGFNDPKNLKKDDVGLFGRIKKPNLLKVGML